jgi:two-component system response regulator PilR (NtrC family)
MGESNKRILVIDDDEGILRALRSHLGRSGFEVDCAHDSGEAHSYLATSRYALVITDLYLTPALTEGLDIVGHVRKNHPETRVALLTGYESPGLESRALRLGADVMLTKSLHLQDITRTVVSLVGDGNGKH